MIRLGLIGAGVWGLNYVTAAREAGNCIVTHAAGAAAGTLIGASPEPIVIEPSREWRLLLDYRLDAFIVATPPNVREEIARTLLEAGRPVMLEKPMALELGASARILLAARKSGAPMLVNHQHLFAPAYEELAARAAGWRETVAMSAGGGIGPRRDYSALWDYGPHDVAMHLGLREGFGSCRVIEADRLGGRFRVWFEQESYSGLLRVWNDRAPKARTFVAMGDTGHLVYDDLDPDGVRLRHNGEASMVSDEKPLTRALRAFANAVAAGGSTDWRMRPDFGVEVTRVLELADARATTDQDAPIR